MNIAKLKTNFSAAEAVTARQEAFKQDVRHAVSTTAARLRADGTVQVGKDCLWQLAAGRISHSVHGPQGTNAAYYARQVFDEVVLEKPFSKFVY
jgi:Asp-tRNA(Asn)/Glu-tRNA(Gln) amidotransferase A subunit family amidase